MATTGWALTKGGVGGDEHDLGQTDMSGGGHTLHGGPGGEGQRSVMFFLYSPPDPVLGSLD